MPRGKKKAASSGKTAGRTSWVKGSKLVFLKARRSEFLEAQEAGGDATGWFYTEIAQLFLLKYGYDHPLESDIDGQLEDPSDNRAATALDFSDLDAEEKARRTAVYNGLRLKLGQWFRHRYKTVPVKPIDATSEILSVMQSISTVRPRKQAAINLYSKRYYNDRIKSKFDKSWAAMKGTVPDNTRINMCKAFIQDAWKKETVEFRETLEKEVDDAYKAAMDDYRKKDSGWTPRTAEEYYKALEESPTILIPFVDAIAQRLGITVSLLMAGPMSDGKVGLCSIHSTTSGGCIDKMWPEFDKEGFSAVEKSITAYGNRFFSKSKCRDRVFSPDDESLEGFDISEKSSLEEGKDNRPGGSLELEESDQCAPPDTESMPTAAPATPSSTAMPASPEIKSTPEIESTPNAISTNNRIPATRKGSTGAAKENLPPSDKPLAKPYRYLVEDRNWGPSWSDCLSLLVEFERGHGYPRDSGRFSKEFRPQEVGVWMKYGQPLEDQEIDDDFASNWWKWWRGLQPKNCSSVAKADWQGLNKAGANGMLLVVITLAWWGHALSEADHTSTNAKGWEATV